LSPDGKKKGKTTKVSLVLLLLAIVTLYTHLIFIKMFARTGSPAFQFVKVTGRPVDIQKKLPSSP
jgi:hypothetical protein